MTQILAVDIGGTNSRFATFSIKNGKSLSIEKVVWIDTAKVNSFEHLVSVASEEIDIEDNDVVVFGVPGPVERGRYANLVNVKWKEVDISYFKKKAKRQRKKVYLINDFVSQAFGCIDSEETELVEIKHAISDTFLGFSVIGAGTGLGHCTLISNNDGTFTEIPSEAGQIPFPFQTEQEFKYRDFAKNELHVDCLRNDDVVSASGLVRLHQYLTGKSMSPIEVSEDIGPQSDTTEWFARFFARSCQNYVLSILPICSALYITGGVVAHRTLLVNNDVFRNEFVNSTKRNDLDKIPIKVNRNENLGLWGSARYGLEHLSSDS